MLMLLAVVLTSIHELVQLLRTYCRTWLYSWVMEYVVAIFCVSPPNWQLLRPLMLTKHRYHFGPKKILKLSIHYHNNVLKDKRSCFPHLFFFLTICLHYSCINVTFKNALYSKYICSADNFSNYLIMFVPELYLTRHISAHNFKLL